MKNFSYLVRDTTGALKRGTISAIDRAAAIKELKATNLVPVEIEEGGKRGKRGQSAPRIVVQRFAKVGYILASVILVVAAGVLLVLRIQLKQKNISNKHVSQTEAAQSPFKGQTNRSNRALVEIPKTETIASHEKNSLMPTVGSTAIVKKAIVEDKTTDAKKEPIPLETPTNIEQAVLFKSGTEQIISWIANCRLGDAPPPLPNLPVKENLIDILNNDIILYEDEGEDIERIKVNVANVKQLLKKYLDEGGRAEDFLAFYHRQLSDINREWMNSQKALLELYKTGKTQDALKYANEQNKSFQTRGVKPLVVPPALNN